MTTTEAAKRICDLVKQEIVHGQGVGGEPFQSGLLGIFDELCGAQDDEERESG